MSKDLVSIGKSNGISIESDLLSATYLGDTHLAVIRQTTAWDNKELVATPKESLYAWAYASGREANSTSWGGAAVKADTDVMITGVANQLANATWNAGPKACFSYFCRSDDPYSNFMDLTNANIRSGHGRSVVALKFSLRGLPLAKMSSWSAYIRAHIPSIAGCEDMQLPGWCIIYDIPLWGSASICDIRFTENQPSIIADGTEATESFELNNYCNNGDRPAAGSQAERHAYIYDPMDIEHLGVDPLEANDQELRVYATGTDNPPVDYYADIPLTADCKTFLGNHMGEFWAAFNFREGNAFSSGTNRQGLQVHYSIMAYIQRFELVLKCTSGTWN